ncbi:hypothetical protein PDO_5349 [Rhizobium sp. PDO1-076]|nr:hypothetical protein PDO_5349 [Rhizobium sp. PDO1-076]
MMRAALLALATTILLTRIIADLEGIARESWKAPALAPRTELNRGPAYHQ